MLGGVYAWNGQVLSKVGLIWRVEDGASIKIWGDKWLLTPTSYAVQSPVRVLDREARVKKLIDEEINCWKVSLIKEIFNEEEVSSICSLP